MHRWACLYPAYINKDKSRAEGRRIPKNKVKHFRNKDKAAPIPIFLLVLLLIIEPIDTWKWLILIPILVKYKII